MRRLRGLAPLLFILAAPGVAGQALPEPDWAIQDNADDVAPLAPGGQPALPDTALWAHADLRGLTIDGETELGLYFTILLEELVVSSDSRVGLFRTHYAVDFGLEGSSYEYRIRVTLWGAPTHADAASAYAVATAFGDLCIRGPQDGCLLQAIDLDLLDEANAIRAWVSKDALLGRGAAPGTRSFVPVTETEMTQPITLEPGQKLTGLRAASRLDLDVPCFLLACPPTVSLYDQAPDAGEAPPYALQTGAANIFIAAQLGDGDDEVSVVAGLNQSVPFRLTNHAAAKRIIQLEYALEGADLAGYAAHGPALVTVPGGESRNLTLALNVPAGATGAQGVHLVVRGRSLVYEHEYAYARAGVAPGLALGPQRNVLTFHTTRQGVFGEPFDTAACATAIVACVQGYLSADPAAPDAGPDGRIEGWGFPTGPTGFLQFFLLPLDQDLPLPVAFDTTSPMELALALEAPVDAEGIRVSAVLSTGDIVLFDEATTTTVAQAGTRLTLEGPVRLQGTHILPAGTALQLRVELTSDLSPTASAAFAAGGIVIAAPESTIRMPLVQLPPELLAQAVPTAIRLAPLSGVEDFVNPGEARLFNVSLINQAQGVRRVDVSTSVQPPTWGIDVMPGTRFDLPPGDSVKLGVLVRAPASAREGETATGWVNATGPDGVLFPLRLTIIATTGDDLRDDTDLFQASEEDLGKVVKDEAKGDSPGPGLLLVLGAAAALVVYRRRRRSF